MWQGFRRASPPAARLSLITLVYLFPSSSSPFSSSSGSTVSTTLGDGLGLAGSGGGGVLGVGVGGGGGGGGALPHALTFAMVLELRSLLGVPPSPLGWLGWDGKRLPPPLTLPLPLPLALPPRLPPPPPLEVADDSDWKDEGASETLPHALALAIAPEFRILLGVSLPPLGVVGTSLPLLLGLASAELLKGDGRSECGEGGSTSGASCTGGALFFF